MAKAYAVVVGAVLLLVGLVGFLTPSLMGLTFHPAHNVIHLLSGILGLWAGLKSEGAARTYARIFGAVYTLVAVVGFAGIHDLGPIMLGLNGMYNIIHLAVGVLGLAAGFMGASAPKTHAAGA